MKTLFCILSLSALLLTSCSKTSSPTSSNTYTNTTPKNTIVATIDGIAFAGKAAASRDSTGVLTYTFVIGIDTNGKSMSLSLPNLRTTGTYSVCSSCGTYISFTYTDAKGQPAEYSSPTYGYEGPDGEITIQELTSTSCIGIFNGTLLKRKGATANPTITVTNGGVNATIQ